MPELDGCAVARALRADPATRAAHVHCLTGHTDPASRRDARAAGCETFLTKPVDAAALLQVVRADVSRAGADWLAGLTKAQAEDWLDWLAAHGYPPAHLSYREGQGFAVRCPGFRVSRDEHGNIRFVQKLNQVYGLGLRHAAQVFHLLGDELRLGVIALLAGGRETTANQLAQALGRSLSAVGSSLELLRLGRLVECRCQDRTHHYRLCSSLASDLLALACGDAGVPGAPRPGQARGPGVT
jgi:CheY-like chemotaxis protein